MLVAGVASLPPSLIFVLWNILLYKQAKLRKYMQHSVLQCTYFFPILYSTYLMARYRSNAKATGRNIVMQSTIFWRG